MKNKIPKPILKLISMLSMTKYFKILGMVLAIAALPVACAKRTPPPPVPYGALPSERQLAWHEMETYAFLHFTVNTFTDKEWGFGDESPQVFDPTDFDADQIVGTLAKAGFKGAILTAKHHDGFCLWPSAYTEHSVKNSSWKDGRGDVVKEISDACKKYGLKFGVYLSPWDRNSTDYGREKYIAYYQNQLKELLTHYGNIFEVWFDGANGGDGYYGGASETRKIDRSTYYQWEQVWDTVRQLQPQAVMFSDAGPDIRWVGNENGHAKDSCWATYTPRPAKGETKAYAGTTMYKEGETGTINGKYWMPVEADVSIRPGWFYHESQDDKVKSLKDLLDIYFHSVGNGTSLNLNVPPDRRGQIHPSDSVRLMEFKRFIDKAFANDLLQNTMPTASDNRGTGYGPNNLTDNDPKTYWAPEDGVINTTIEFRLNKSATFNCMVLQEYIPLGERIDAFTVEVFENGKWKEVAKGSTIGYKKILRFKDQNGDRVRVHIMGALAIPLLSEVKLYDIDYENLE